jgi:hypothetical protein
MPILICVIWVEQAIQLAVHVQVSQCRIWEADLAQALWGLGGKRRYIRRCLGSWLGLAVEKPSLLGRATQRFARLTVSVDHPLPASATGTTS